jgi:hypothetical protein
VPPDDRATALIRMLNDMDALRRVLRMYPDGHPSVEGAKERIRRSAGQLAAEGSATLAFGPDTLLLDGEAVGMPAGGPVSRLVALLFYLGLSSLRLAFPAACNGLARLATHLAPCREPPQAEDRVRLFAAANDFEGVELVAIDLSGIQLAGPEEARRAAAHELWRELSARLGGRFEGLLGAPGVDGEEGFGPEQFIEALGRREDWRELCDGLFGELEGALGRVQPAQRDNVLEAIRGFVAAPVSLPDPERSVYAVATAIRRVPAAVVPRDDGTEVVPPETLLGAVESLLLQHQPLPESVVTLARSLIDAHLAPDDPLADRVARVQALLDAVAAAMRSMAVAVPMPTRLDWDDPAWNDELRAATREANLREHAVAVLRHAVGLAPGTPLEARVQRRLADELVAALELGDLATAAVLAPQVAAAASPETRDQACREALPLAVRALEGGDADRQALVAGVLTSLGEGALPGILESVATSEDGTVRRVLLEVVLGAGATAVPHVRRLLADARPQVQRNAVFLMRRLNDTECQPLLKARLRTAAAPVAAEILKFLITVQDPEWPALLLRELAATDEERLAAAAAVAGHVPRKDVLDRVLARLAERVGPSLQQESTLELIRAAGRLRSPAALPVLQEILKLKQWRCRFPLGPARAEAARAVAQLEGNEARRLAYSLASSGEAGVAEAAQDGLRRSRSRERKAEP